MAARNIPLDDGALITVILPNGSKMFIKVNPGGGGNLAYDTSVANQVNLLFTATKGAHSWVA